MLARGSISRKPDGRKMTPAEFSHYNVFSIVVRFADVDGVVTTFAVVFRVFFIGGGFGGVFIRCGGGGRSVKT